MSKHDVTQSSNPDVQALLVVITGLASQIDRLQAQVFALAGEIAALPEQYVVPGPNGELPPGTELFLPKGDGAVKVGEVDSDGVAVVDQGDPSIEATETPPQDERGDDDVPF